MWLHLRIDTEFEPVLHWLQQQDVAGFGVREFSTREHMHFCIRTDKTIEAFRKAFKRAFAGMRGNAEYSLAEAQDYEKLRRYCSKGESRSSGPDVVYSYGIDFQPEHISLFHEQYWAENATIEASRRGRKLNQMAETEQRCRDAKVVWNDRDMITEIYAEVVKDFGKTYDVNLARRTVRGVMIALCPNDSFKKTMVEHTWY